MEDSSRSPGTMRSRLLLGRTIFLISLHIHQLGSESFNVIGPDRPIRALVGEGALLPCHLSPRMSAEHMEVRWFRSTFSAVVHLYRDGRDQADQQIAPYRSRTKLLKDGIANGNVSLRIYNITPSDEGTYGCLFQSPSYYKEAVLELEVVGLGASPHLSVDGFDRDGGIRVVCQSAGWYPEPRVLWRDARGQQLAPATEDISRQADGLFNTHSAVVVTDASTQNLSCSVSNPCLGQGRTAALHIADVFLPRISPSQVALAVALAGVSCLLALASYGFWKQHREKAHLQADLEREREILRAELEKERGNLQAELEKEREILRSELKNEREKSLAELGWSKVSKYAVNVILDPDTAHPSLAVSESRRSVRWGLRQDVSDNPQRFDCETCVLGSGRFTSGRHYWEVEVGGGRTWAVGVARESVRRKGWISFSPDEGIWAVDQCGSHYRARTTPETLLPLNGSPGRIGVYLDYDRGLVSFYHPGMEVPIYTFTSSFSGTLYPFFWVYSPVTLLP